MAFHVGRQLLLLSLGLILLLHLTEARPKGDNNGDGDGDDDDDSSSEETVEDSAEAGRRRKRDISGNSIGTGRAGIPGLPDPATIIKIAQLFQSVGEQIVPILLEAVLPGAGEATGDRIARKRSLESVSLELNKLLQ